MDFLPYKGMVLLEVKIVSSRRYESIECSKAQIKINL